MMGVGARVYGAASGEIPEHWIPLLSARTTSAAKSSVSGEAGESSEDVTDVQGQSSISRVLCDRSFIRFRFS